ncbi:methyl-accepting chemotaxis protein [Ornithinibacillus contaminans]|uniref:methyl-accepting chemotaxis protein n=1 Tax=Ornithinibacillus contaminans TaxID=694055 RepID=UPI00064DA049|nr:HAMP domain-containing methyl-accepting chemotaxis protein [Ornithinibacillus contaminans]
MARKFRFKKIKLKKVKLRDIKIGWKYGITLAIVLLLFIVTSYKVSTSIMEIGEGIDELEIKSDIAMNISEMGSLTRNMSVFVISYFQEQDPSFVEEFTANQVQYNELASDVRIHLKTEEQKEIFQQISSNNQEMYRIFTNYIVSAIENNNLTSAESFVEQSNELREESVSLLDELVVTVNAEREDAISSAKDAQQETFVSLVVSIWVSIIISVILVVLISRVISRNLKKVVQVSNQIAEGDLTATKVDYEGNDEIGQLAASISKMSTYLTTIIKQVSTVSHTVTGQSEALTQSANEVRAGADQIASTMQELAAGSEKQADSASNLAHTMHSFSSKVQEANVNGERIQQSSESVLDLTGQGTHLMQASGEQMTRIDHIVQEAVSKVQGLDENSKAISQLVSVIQDIADQTNLLALNAAIEAARAGEHGKGFAVVADEVRRLSEQVSVSVTDITGIVKKIQSETSSVTQSLEEGYQEVQQGTKQIITTSETFTDISKAVTDMVENIKVVKDNLIEIAATTNEMGTSVEEIAAISEESAAGIEQTSASSQQTSSSMEEMTASSEELAKLAEELNSLIRQFKL